MSEYSYPILKEQGWGPTPPGSKFRPYITLGILALLVILITAC